MTVIFGPVAKYRIYGVRPIKLEKCLLSRKFSCIVEHLSDVKINDEWNKTEVVIVNKKIKISYSLHEKIDFIKEKGEKLFRIKKRSILHTVITL